MNRDEIKSAAIEMVREGGLINLSRRELCERVGIPDGSFPHIMGCNFCDLVDELRGEGVDHFTAPVSKRRASPKLRKDYILDVALEMSEDCGYYKLTRDAVAERAGISMGLVTRYFGTMQQLKKAVMRRAVKREIVSVVAQGLANGDDHARKAPTELKKEAAALLADY